MINTINQENHPAIFEYFVKLINDLEYDDTVINQEDDYWDYREFIIKMHENDIPIEFHGYWKSDSVNCSRPIYNHISTEDIIEFKRVIKQSREVKVIEVFYTEV